MGTRYRRYAVLVVVGVVVGQLALAAMPGYAQGGGLQTTDLGSGVTPQQLASLLATDGSVSVSNVVYRGASSAAGTFTGNPSIIGFGSGIVLSTGNIRNIVGPNASDEVTQENNTSGDPDLNQLVSGANTFDAAILEFDVVTTSPTLAIRQYVFGSDEYNEFANTPFNDVFAFFVNGRNIALVPGTTTPVSINTINGGNPLGVNTQNPQFFRNNDLSDGGGTINTELDGLTVVLVAQVPVTPGAVNRVKLAIADVGDQRVDSAVLLATGSLSSANGATPTGTTTATPAGTPVRVPTATATPMSRAEVGDDDDDKKPRRLTETQRQQRQRTNEAGLDDYRTEGNVVSVACGSGNAAPLRDDRNH